MDQLFRALAKLMDERIISDLSEALKAFNTFREDIDKEWIPAIQRISYTGKYSIIMDIQELCNDILLYLSFPELINVTVIAFYHQNKAGMQVIYDNYLREQNLALSDSVPTILYSRVKQEMVRVLNSSEKIAFLTNDEYRSLLHYSAIEKMDLSALSYAVSIAALNAGINNAYLVIPKGTDTYQKYYKSFLRAADVLVIHGMECIEEILISYTNISRICVYGKVSEENETILRKCRDVKSLSVRRFVSFAEVLKCLSCAEYQKRKNNFCYSYYLRNKLFEVSWYLAARYAELNALLKYVSDNIFYNNENRSYFTRLKREYKKQMSLINKAYQDYKSVCEKLIQKMENIQNIMGIRESGRTMNEHIHMHDKLFRLTIKVADIQRIFPETKSREIVRHYCSVYKQACKSKAFADFLLNNFLENQAVSADLGLLEANVPSVVMLRKLIDICNNNNRNCEKIIYNFPIPFESIKKRLLGEYYLSRHSYNRAKRFLLEALEDGDQKAGEMLSKYFRLKEGELKSIADYGVASAACRIGKILFDAHRNDECMLYLHIAASGNSRQAVELLGNISYEQYINSQDISSAEKALKYYLLLLECDIADTSLQERIGYLYFCIGNGKNAVKFCKEADTGFSNYILSRIYAGGKGYASDQKVSEEYLSRAKSKGYTFSYINRFV